MPPRVISLIISLLLLLTAVPSQAEINSLSEAINKAGRQRMLTQRMVKSYCMIGIDVQRETAQEQLTKAIDLFDLQLQELTAYSHTESITNSLDKVEALWIPFKKILQQPVSRKNAEELLDTNDELLRATHKVVLKLEDISGSSFGRLVNVSGRQRMLTQRLAKFYMLRSWQFNNAEIRSEVQQAKNEFKGALSELMSSKENNAEINKALKKASIEWDLFKHGLEREQQDLIPLIVAVSSEKLLITMNQITGMYERLSNQ